MDGIFPIEEFLQEVSPEAPCGILDEVTSAQISALDDAVKRASNERLHLIRRAAEGLFNGGKIPLLSDPKGEATTNVKPVKHLKAAMVLTWVGLGLEGLPGFADGLVLMDRLLKDWWLTVHPVADPPPSDEPCLHRFNVLVPLTFADPASVKSQSGPVVASDSWRIEGRLLKAILLKSDRHGELSLRDCLSPWAKSLRLSLPNGEDRSAEFVHEARLGAAIMLPEQRKAVQAAISAAEGIEAAFKTAPGVLKPKFDYLLRLLKAAQNVLDDVVPSPATTGALENKSPAPGLANGSVGGPVSSREEALRRLAEAADYFRRVEPSSPIPLLIKRVQTLAGLDFARLIQELELGADAVKEFRKQAGIREEIPGGPATK